jgi:hypothetical protein
VKLLSLPTEFFPVGVNSTIFVFNPRTGIDRRMAGGGSGVAVGNGVGVDVGSGVEVGNGVDVNVGRGVAGGRSNIGVLAIMR